MIFFQIKIYKNKLLPTYSRRISHIASKIKNSPDSEKIYPLLSTVQKETPTPLALDSLVTETLLITTIDKFMLFESSFQLPESSPLKNHHQTVDIVMRIRRNHLFEQNLKVFQQIIDSNGKLATELKPEVEKIKEHFSKPIQQTGYLKVDDKRHRHWPAIAGAPYPYWRH